MSHRFPPELFNEIIGYLWNHIPSLKACSLTHRSMTVPSQKRLFYSICLRAPRKRLNSLKLVKNEISGTSYDLWRMLVRSPHIAGYVRSLFVIDHSHSYRRFVDSASSEDDQTEFGFLDEDDELGSGEYVVSKPTRKLIMRPAAQKTVNPRTRRISRWLTNDKYLPRCALLLHNLKAFTLIYDEEWRFLSSKIHIALLRLMRLSSLLYVRLESYYPSKNFDVAIGDNVKHLILPCRPRSDQLSVLPRCPSSGPLCVDSLEIHYPYEFLDSHLEGPYCRIETSRLRKLVIIADKYDEHAAIWTILQTCSETLEDFEFTPSEEVMDIDHFHDPIDLSKLTSLKRFAIHLRVSYDDDDPDSMAFTAFPWFNRILLTQDPLPVSQQLEEISILMFDYKQENDLLPCLKDTFGILLDDRFKTLKKINISVGLDWDDMDVVDVLNSSQPVANLRSQTDMVVDVRACNRPLCFEPDVRWEIVSWKRWNHIDVHDDCREVSQVW